MLKVFNILIITLFISGCAGAFRSIRGVFEDLGWSISSYNVDFKSELRTGKKIIVGRINILYEGENVNLDCGILFNDDTDYKVGVSLKEDGFIFLSTPVSENSITDIYCHSPLNIYYDFPFNKFSLKKDITYIGDITLELIDKRTKSGISGPFTEHTKLIVSSVKATKDIFEKNFELKVSETKLISFE